jgi:hypothetical protein
VSRLERDRKLRQLALETALSCPCCGALLQLTTSPDLHPEEADVAEVMLQLLRERNLQLVTIEDAEARAKERAGRDT